MLDLSLLVDAARSRFVANSVVGGLVHHDFEDSPASYKDIVYVQQPDSFRTRHGFDAQVPVKLDDVFYSACSVPTSYYCMGTQQVAHKYVEPTVDALTRTLDQIILRTAYKIEPQVVPGFGTQATTCLTDAQRCLDAAKAPDTNRYLIVGPSGERVLSDNLPNQLGFSGYLCDHADKLAEGLNFAWHRDALVLATRPYVGLDPDPRPGTLIHTVRSGPGAGLQITVQSMEKETCLRVSLLAGVGILDKSMIAILPDTAQLDWSLTN